MSLTTRAVPLTRRSALVLGVALVALDVVVSAAVSMAALPASVSAKASFIASSRDALMVRRTRPQRSTS